jgi:hypothetical protein
VKTAISFQSIYYGTFLSSLRLFSDAFSTNKLLGTKVQPRTSHEGPRWWVVNVTPRLIYPRERPCTNCTEGPVWTIAENLTRTAIRFPEVQPVASRYTDCAVLVHVKGILSRMSHLW